MNLDQIVDFMDQNAPCFLATKGTCGNPRIRPFHSPLLFNDKIYFCTAKSKNLAKHINAWDGIEISCANIETGEFIRVRAKAKFEENLAAKKAMFEKYPDVAQIYKTPENPDFAVFYLGDISAKKF